MFNLKEKLINEYGDEVANKICDGYQIKKAVCIRINTSKIGVEDLKKELDNLRIRYRVVEFSDSALILDNVTEFDLQNMKIYEDGLIYLQSLSSQLPPLFMDLKDNEQILDMAAAPGGKTCEMACLANVMITACEKNRIRCERLKYNINKQGIKRITVMQVDARNLDDYFKFDKVLLDAPCSGSGTLTNCLLDGDLVDRSVKFQKELLEKAIKLVKKDGIIVYSTCSVLKEENENIIREFIGKQLEVVPINIDGDLPLLKSDISGTICLYPNDLYEGFFIAKLRKIVD